MSLYVALQEAVAEHLRGLVDEVPIRGCEVFSEVKASVDQRIRERIAQSALALIVMTPEWAGGGEHPDVRDVAVLVCSRPWRQAARVVDSVRGRAAVRWHAIRLAPEQRRLMALLGLAGYVRRAWDPPRIWERGAGGGGGTLYWTITTNDVIVAPNIVSGSSTGQTTVVTVASPGTLAAGSYEATITVSSTNAINSPQTITVTRESEAPPAESDRAIRRLTVKEGTVSEIRITIKP